MPELTNLLGANRRVFTGGSTRSKGVDIGLLIELKYDKEIIK